MNFLNFGWNTFPRSLPVSMNYTIIKTCGSLWGAKENLLYSSITYGISIYKDKFQGISIPLKISAVFYVFFKKSAQQVSLLAQSTLYHPICPILLPLPAPFGYGRGALIIYRFFCHGRTGRPPESRWTSGKSVPRTATPPQTHAACSRSRTAQVHPESPAAPSKILAPSSAVLCIHLLRFFIFFCLFTLLSLIACLLLAPRRRKAAASISRSSLSLSASMDARTIS